MKHWFRRSLSLLTIGSLMAGTLGGCAVTPDATAPQSITWASYNSTGDADFLPKDIFSQALFVPGLILSQTEGSYFEVTDNTDSGAFVLQGEYGKCYEVKIPAGVSSVCAARLKTDPRKALVGEQLGFSTETTVFTATEGAEAAAFMYTCRQQQEYLVIFTGSADPVYIGERSILAAVDVQDQWYLPDTVGSIYKDGSYGYVGWTSDEVLENLYEPVRKKYPEYISRTVIGKDHSGQYDMYGYVYTPENYKITMFITGGMHGNEETAYFSLAKIMQLIADATPADTLLYTLRQQVRFVVVPMINVWSISQPIHTRKNSSNVDLNRDFGDLSQQESQNVMAWFRQYAQDAVIAMDFHNSSAEDVALWFNFINYTPNSVANYKTANHMYHRYMELGLAQAQTDISHLPGSYVKSDKYIEGRIWNEYGVPTITVEFSVNSTFPAKFSSESMTLAVETYSNFIIQNALFFLQNE